MGLREASDLGSVLGLLPGPELCGQPKCGVGGIPVAFSGVPTCLERG